MTKSGTSHEDSSTDMLNYSLISTLLKSMIFLQSKRQRGHLQAWEKVLAVGWRTEKRETKILGPRRLSPSKFAQHVITYTWSHSWYTHTVEAVHTPPIHSNTF